MTSGITFEEDLSYSLTRCPRYSGDIYWVEITNINGTLWRDYFHDEEVPLVTKILTSRSRTRVNVEHKNPTIRSLCRKLLGLPIDTPRFRKDPVLWRRFSLVSHM